MKHDDSTSILLDYLDGVLPDDERRELERRLAEDSALRQALAELKTVLAAVGQLPEQAPSPQAESRFLAFLDREKTALAKPGLKGKLVALFSPRSLKLDLVAAVVLLLIGAGFGWFWSVYQRQHNEVQALRQEIRNTQRLLVLSMLEKPSASERIRAVNVLEKEEPDPKITDALIQTMNADDMTNVRMKAAQALGHFGDATAVKQALIDGLATQESPEVQIAIIDALVAIGDKRAVPSFQQMVNDKDVMEIVRKRAASGIAALL